MQASGLDVDEDGSSASSNMHSISERSSNPTQYSSGQYLEEDSSESWVERLQVVRQLIHHWPESGFCSQ